MTTMRDLPPRAREELQRFLGPANRSLLHPYDWRRWYRFIGALHPRTRASLRPDGVRDFLIENGFNEYQAAEAACAFEHIRTYLGGYPRR